MNAYTLWISKNSKDQTMTLWTVEVVDEGVVYGTGRGGTKRLAIIEALEDAGVL